jgi:alpha-glucoside transport system substrate-binding protein
MKRALILILCILLSSVFLFAEEDMEVGEGKIGGSVSVIAVWGGQELEVFKDMVAPFTEETGIKVEFEGTRDIDAVLTTRIAAGNPPDVAGLPGPGKMAEMAKSGDLVDLSTVLDMDKIRRDYAQGWIDLGTVDGKLVGLFTKVSIKGLIWYNPSALEKQGITIPKTWDEMMNVSRQLANRGIAPWGIGLESGAASGWSGTDWLENIFLRVHGPDKYKDWYEGKLAWTSPEMKEVWRIWGEIVADPKMIYGGKQYVLSTNFGQGFEALFFDEPKAYFHHQASFIQGFIQDMYPDLQPITDFNYFGFPTIKSEYANALEAAGDLFGMLNDTPQARAFIQYFSTPEAQAYWTTGTGALSANRNLSLVFYPDPMVKNSARILQEAEQVVFDASDLMPSEMNNAFWSAVMSYVENPSNLDKILTDLDKVRMEAY